MPSLLYVGKAKKAWPGRGGLRVSTISTTYLYLSVSPRPARNVSPQTPACVQHVQLWQRLWSAQCSAALTYALRRRRTSTCTFQGPCISCGEGGNYAALASVRPEPLGGGLAALRRPSSEACAPSGQAVAARPPRAAQAQVSRPTRADRRDDGALVVTRAAHGRLRHQVAADRAEVETAA